MSDTSSPARPPADDLASLRAEIDALDDALHDLLMRRSAIVARLASSRAKGATVPLRPGREAAILRRLIARHAGPLPKAALVRMWREIFADSIALQNSFSVVAQAAAPGVGLARLARDHFGGVTPVRSHPTSARALAAVSGGEASVAVLPLPADGDDADPAWWASLEAPRLQVIARLPFIGAAEPAGLVVAPVPADASGDDRSLIRVEGASEPARARITASLEASGFKPLNLLVRRSGDAFMALAEVEGFVPTDDTRLASSPIGRLRSLGAYAVPMSGD